MLQDLFIKDFAIIESLHISFDAGLTMITGETGAGKSIIVGAVSLLMGGRASADMIRTGSSEAVAEAIFDISANTALLAYLEENGLSAENGQLLIRRIISRTGKNRILVGDRPATMQMLAQLAGMLLDISGQYSQQLLLQTERHIDLLDAYGSLLPLRQAYRSRYESFLNTAAELDQLTEKIREAARQKELLAFQLDEITQTALKNGEEATLLQERQIVAGANTLYEKAFMAYTGLYEQDPSCLGTMKRLLRELREAAAIDPELSRLADAFDSSLLGLEDTALSLRDYAEKIDINPSRLDQIDSRLNELHTLKKKYGKSIPEIIALGEDIRIRLESIEGSSARVAELTKDLSQQADGVWQAASELSAGRMKAARTLKKKVEAELASIGMAKAAFSTAIDTVLRPADTAAGAACCGLTLLGADIVQFYISPNQGEEPKPLSRIASGGEISRIVLALKKIIASNYSIPTLLFDEVDAGIGGAVAESVARMLVEIADSHQVLCITHLPQIACFGSQHLCVLKTPQGGRTITRVCALDPGQRVEELARMLGGLHITEATRSHAGEMISAAHDFIHQRVQK